MSENNYDEDYLVLERLLVGDPDFERLEALVDEFNIFEALGVVRHELRHSDYLAFLLDPQQNHGLGDSFLTRFLQRAVHNVPRDQLPISPVQLDLWSLEEVTILREWENIDILIMDEDHQFAVIIENKIDSGEHSKQLERYYDKVRRQYPNWKILPLYLTPSGIQPRGDLRYFPCGYDVVYASCEEMLSRRSSMMGDDVRVLLRHYVQILRRYIMSETPIAKLCEEIYRKHRHALDLIYEHRPDRQDSIRHCLEELISSQESTLIQDDSTKTYIRFLAKEWDYPIIRRGEGWTRTGRMLLYEFENYDDYVKIKLVIGPGPHAIRQRLFEMAQAHSIFKARGSVGEKWKTIYSRLFVSHKVGADLEMEEYKSRLHEEWDRFFYNECQEINRILTGQEWMRTGI
jgi:hypothetical protein